MNILLAGASASGKSTLARALRRRVVSTSAILRSRFGNIPDSELFEAGRQLDDHMELWVSCGPDDVVDAIRSEWQEHQFNDCIRVNVLAGYGDRYCRHHSRGTTSPNMGSYLFKRPDFTWDSSKVSLSTAVSVVSQLCGTGCVDIIVGGQYGSEGKGKLASILAPDYGALVRSGGPNAGHWVRNFQRSFCYHHLPSGTMDNPTAEVMIAAGASLGPGFAAEVAETGCADRLSVDPQAVIISEQDRDFESSGLVGSIGSTGQGVGKAASNRVLRNSGRPVEMASTKFPEFVTHPVNQLLREYLASGANALIEGTQGSGLSLYHGPYPFVTSRDTNAGGLLAEVGAPPSAVRDVWMVVRSLPIRVGGNSGPMSLEMSWQDVADKTGIDLGLLMGRELTSTTKRQRRVGAFDFRQFAAACGVNRPSKLFLSFADYLDPAAAGVTDWAKLPEPVKAFVAVLEQASGSVVAGVSTGRMQDQTCWRSR